MIPRWNIIWKTVGELAKVQFTKKPKKDGRKVLFTPFPIDFPIDYNLKESHTIAFLANYDKQ